VPPIAALTAASAASIPGLLVSHYLVTGHKMSLQSAWASFISVATWLLPIYIVGAFVYGAALWLVLKALGQLNLAGFLIGSLAPVVIYLLADTVIRGYGAGWHIALFAFGVPCLFMGFALWFFSLRWPLGA
jgi:hypothetical protein